jgi:hypothetical protein
MSKQYWFANQTRNFAISTRDGTLWTPFVNDVGSVRESAKNMSAMEVGDVVFHYWKPHIRATSIVIASPRKSRRPRGYAGGAHTDEGWLVRVQMQEPRFHLELLKASGVIAKQPGGPLDRNGRPGQGKYISPLTPESAASLFEMAGAPEPELSLGQDDLYDEPLSGKGYDKTDIQTLAIRRAEQADLRESLLASEDPRCAICHRRLPQDLLVAGHIKPRRACSDAERQDFANVAMLVCSLGCDTLYEKGYIAVDREGLIVRMARILQPDVEIYLAPLVGNSCLRFNNRTAPHYAWHHANTFKG